MKIAAALLFSIGLYGQTAAVLSPPTLSPLFGTSGSPLSAGQLFTCVAGSSCPGTPLASYTDSSGSTPNTNPVVLNAAGMAPVWLANVPYKLVLKTSAGVTVATVDNYLAGGFSTTGPWSTSGSTIYNGTANSKVCVTSSGLCTALSLLNIQGTSSGTNYLVRIDDSGNSPGINLYGSGVNLGSYAADSSGLRLRSGSGNSQMTVADGNVTVQNAGSGSTTLTIKAGFAQGSTNLLNVLSNGGVTLGYIDANARYVGTLFNAASSLDTELTFKNANDKFSVNGGGDLSIAGGMNATGANGNDPYKVNGTTIVDAAGNATFTTLTCTGTPCGSGGGGGGAPGGVTDSIQIRATSSTFGGDANFKYTPGTGIVQLLGAGYVTSHGGFVSDGTATNIIQAPNGGILGQTLRTTDSVIWVEAAAPPASASGQSRMYMDSTEHKVKLSQHTGTFEPLATTSGALVNGNCVSIDASGNLIDAGGPCTVGGGGGTVSASTAQNIAYYTAGTTVAGSANFKWDNAVQHAYIVGTLNTLPALSVSLGYTESSGGFTTTSAATNAVNAINGGVASKWLYTSDSLILSEEAAPALSAAGQARIYADSSTHTLRLSQNGSTYAAIGSGGGGVTSITGTANQVIANVPTGAVILSLPQSIATTSSVTFGHVTTPAIASDSFQNNAASFDVDALANVKGAIFNATGAPGAYGYRVNNFTVIDSNRNASVVNLTVSGTCTGCGSGGGGVTSVAGTPNQVIVSGSTGAVTFSLPQSIGFSSSPTFSHVTATGMTADSFQNNSASFDVDSSANVKGAIFNSVGGDYRINNFQVINSSRQFVGSGVDVGANGINAGGYNVNGGLIGQNWNITFGSPFAINGSGSFNQLVVRGGIIVSAFDIFGGAKGFIGLWVLGLAFALRRRASTSYGARCRRCSIG